MSDKAKLAPARFAISRSGATLALPYASSQPIDVRDERIVRVVFSLHGSGGDALKYLDNATLAAQRKPGASMRTLIVAPQFAMPDNLDESVPPGVLHWTGNPFWGGESAMGAAFQISSFECLDRLARAVLDRDRFPNLLHAVFVGHSGGGQLAQRYAACTTAITAHAATIGVDVHFVPMNPGNWMYLNDRRFDAATEAFVKPPAGPCPGYNNYGRGLGALTGPYFQANGHTAASVRNHYRQQRVSILIGLEDKNLTPGDDDYESLPKTCADNLQGQHRLDRARTFQRHLATVYPEGTGDQHRLLEVPHVGHWGEGMMTSDVGVGTIYADVADFSCQIFQMTPAGQIGPLTDRRAWTDGWSVAKAYAVGSSRFLFLLKDGSGQARIFRLFGDGRIGDEVAAYQWTPGWTTVSFYRAGTSTYLFLLKWIDGTVHVHRMNTNGTVGPRVDTRDWSDKWSHAEPFYYGTTPYLFLLKGASGVVHIHKIKANGEIGAIVEEHDWSGGWTSLSSFSAAGFPHVAMAKAGSGWLRIQRLGADGKTVWPIHQQEDWTGDWTQAFPFMVSGASYLFSLRRDNGSVSIRRIGADGKLAGGAPVQQTRWSSGWTAVTSYTLGGKTFLIATKKWKMDV